MTIRERTLILINIKKTLLITYICLRSEYIQCLLNDLAKLILHDLHNFVLQYIKRLTMGVVSITCIDMEIVSV
jgi:hypothetical protein